MGNLGANLCCCPGEHQAGDFFDLPHIKQVGVLEERIRSVGASNGKRWVHYANLFVKHGRGGLQVPEDHNNAKYMSIQQAKSYTVKHSNVGFNYEPATGRMWRLSTADMLWADTSTTMDVYVLDDSMVSAEDAEVEALSAEIAQRSRAREDKDAAVAAKVSHETLDKAQTMNGSAEAAERETLAKKAAARALDLQRALPERLKAAQEPESLVELLSTNLVQLIHASWIQQCAHRSEIFRRRQELPSAAEVMLIDAEKAAASEDVRVVLFGWLALDHPDPDGHHLKLLGSEINRETTECRKCFLDYCSLHQDPRTCAEEELFRLALSGLHFVFGHTCWSVYRLVDIPASAPRPSPFEKRLWCYFETAVAAAGSLQLITLRSGQEALLAASPVPLPPECFQMELLNTWGDHADASLVATRYAAVWPALAAKRTRMVVYGWDDVRAKEFLNVLPQLPALKEVKLVNPLISEDMASAFATAMRSYGGELVLGA